MTPNRVPGRLPLESIIIIVTVVVVIVVLSIIIRWNYNRLLSVWWLTSIQIYHGVNVKEWDYVYIVLNVYIYVCIIYNYIVCRLMYRKGYIYIFYL